MWAIRNSSEDFYWVYWIISNKRKYIIEDDQDKKLFNESYELAIIFLQFRYR